MKRASMFGTGLMVAGIVLAALAGCEPKGSTGTAAPAAPAAPAVKMSSEPMKPEEMGQAGGAAGAAGARAVLQPAVDTPGFSATVTFTQEGGQLHVVADLSGVPPGSHGFHIHENGQCDHDQHFTSAGGHFNPTAQPHGCPEAASHHAGDLGNVVIRADSTGHLDVTTSALSLSGPSSVIGKAVILHAGADDCTSQPAGNAGARLACGVVTASGGGAGGTAGSASH
jgi:Cu-Zn family superoxide dismutase